MTDVPQIPDELLSQVLSDPEAVDALQQLAARAGVTTPVADMPRDEQVALVTAMMNIAQQAQNDGANDNPNPGNNPADIPADLISQIFADPQADTILREIMEGNQLAGEPADLPDDIKRAIVQMLIDQGVISFEDPGAQST